MTKCKLVIILLITICNSVYSQVSEYQFNYLRTEDGLSSNVINCFYEDALGFMWIGTDNGLNRYDGSTVKVFKSNDGPGSIIHANIKALEQDYNSPNFWIGTTRGLCLFNLDTYKASTIPTTIDTARLMQRIPVLDLKFDKRGALWIASINNIFRYDSTITQLTKNEQIYRRGIKFIYSSIEVSATNEIIFGGKDGLSRFNPNTQSVEFIESTVGIGDVCALHFDSDGDLWAGTLKNGAYRYKNGDLDAEPEYFSVKNKKLISDLVNDIAEYENGIILLVNKEKGIAIYNKKTAQFKYLVEDVANQHGLNSKAILSLGVDSKKNLWIGSYNNGVNYFDKQRKKIGHYALNFTSKGLFNKNVRSFFEDSKGYIWIGTKEGGGLSRFNPENRTFKHYRVNKSDRNALHGDNVTAINEIDERYLLVGTFLNGLHILDRKTDRFKQYLPNKNDPNSLSDHYITALEKHPNGKMMVAHGLGVDLFDIKNETFTPFFTRMTGRSLYVENADSIWLGSLHGIYLLSPNADIIRVYNNSDSEDENTYPLHTVNIVSIKKDLNGNVWAASGYNGLYKLADNRKSFTHYHYPGSGLKNKVAGMLIDDHSNIWYSSRNGISKFDTKTETFQHLQKLDGLQGNQFERHAALKTSRGYMLFGGRNGFNIFHPDSIKLNKTPPKVAITEFKIFDKDVEVGGENSPLSKHISQTKDIVLNYQQSMLSFEYVAINYSSPLKNEYAYMMEGVDKDWRFVGNTRNATYTNMREGDYVFKVKASNNDGVWNEKGVELHITILPPWWRTTWFRLLLAATVISILFIAFYLRIKQLKQQQELLRQKVKERTAELANKNELLEKQTQDLNEANEELTRLNATKDKFFSIIAHDLRNPFSSILGLCDMLVNEYDNIDDNQRFNLISGIDESSKKVFQLLENLLNWARSQSKAITIKLQRISLFEEFLGIRELVADGLKSKNLEMIISIPRELNIDSDPNLFEAIFRNFITNAIKFSSDGKLEIIGEDFDDKVRITVKDCGVGMTQETIDKLFNNQFVESSFGTMGEAGTGIGLVICREFIALLGGQLKVESEPGAGSSFIVELPKEIKQA